MDGDAINKYEENANFKKFCLLFRNNFTQSLSRQKFLDNNKLAMFSLYFIVTFIIIILITFIVYKMSQNVFIFNDKVFDNRYAIRTQYQYFSYFLMIIFILLLTMHGKLCYITLPKTNLKFFGIKVFHCKTYSIVENLTFFYIKLFKYKFLTLFHSFMYNTNNK